MLTPDMVAAPRQVGRYTLYEEIASGGMASVHIGRMVGTAGFALTVAVKRLHPQFAKDPDFVSMFLDEAHLAARIRHANVVATLDVVSLDTELFLVMEHVRGESLARLLRAARQQKARVPLEVAGRIIVDVLHGLHAAHEAKKESGEPLDIVHRDVSPQNVLVGTDGTARILDFGIAKAIGRLQTTRDGQLKGKTGYMAPEQIRGTVARTTDVYATGVVLWEMLTGKRLFHGDNEASVLARVLAGEAERPSKFVPELPPELDDLTMRAISVNPTDRFPTALDMSRALEKALAYVNASEIGAWVEKMAGPELAVRSRRIAEIETESSAPSEGRSTVDSMPRLAADSFTGATGMSPVAVGTSSNLSLSRESEKTTADQKKKKKKRQRLMLAGGVLAAGLLGSFVWSNSPTKTVTSGGAGGTRVADPSAAAPEAVVSSVPSTALATTSIAAAVPVASASAAASSIASAAPRIATTGAAGYRVPPKIAGSGAALKTGTTKPAASAAAATENDGTADRK
jgi:serine/threonine-protein kinase